MTASSVDPWLALLPTVDLAELEAQAPLMTRRDRKYVVPVETAKRLLEVLGSSSSARVLEIDRRRSFGYQSVYFDTPERVSFFATARRRRRRFKVRTRRYVDAERAVLELKTRDGRGRTVKNRISIDQQSMWLLDKDGIAFVRAAREVGPAADRLQPALQTSYLRSTLVLSSSSRVTIDLDLQASVPDGRSASLPGFAVIESKSAGQPTDADRALWSLGYRPIRLSKYCTTLALIDRSLPTNRWTRALGRPWVADRARLAAAG